VVHFETAGCVVKDPIV